MKISTRSFALLAALTASQFSFAAEGDVSVAIDAFSGRANPIIEINLSDADAAASSLQSLLNDVNSGNLTVASESTSTESLDYKGLVVFDPTGALIASDTSVKIVDGTIEVTTGGSTTTFVNPYADLEQQIIHFARSSGQIDKRVYKHLSQQ